MHQFLHDGNFSQNILQLAFEAHSAFLFAKVLLFLSQMRLSEDFYRLQKNQMRSWRVLQTSKRDHLLSKLTSPCQMPLVQSSLQRCTDSLSCDPKEFIISKFTIPLRHSILQPHLFQPQFCLGFQQIIFSTTRVEVQKHRNSSVLSLS